MNLNAGQLAPDFSLPDQDGALHRLSDYRGQWVVLYFYPQDDTPGCTTEACSMRDNLPHFNQVKAKVLGVSTDSVLSHRQFADKYKLTFTLLADEQESVVSEYGVVRNSSGGKPGGVMRTTFIIDSEGRINKKFENVNPDSHAEDVVAYLQNAATKADS